MYTSYDNECRKALLEVVDQRSLEAPNPQNIRLLGLGELALDSVVDTIRSFNKQGEFRASRLHQWISELTRKMEQHIKEDENYFIFGYNGVKFHVQGYRGSLEEEGGLFFFWLKTASSFFNDEFLASSIKFVSETPIDEDLHLIAYKIIEIVRKEIFCEVCGGICKEVYSTHIGRGICNSCSGYFNEPGCRVCKNPFGRLTDGMHHQCAKKRRVI